MGNNYFERNAQGEPIKFIYVDDNDHKGLGPHVHVVDLQEATIGDLDKGGRWNDLRDQNTYSQDDYYKKDSNKD